MLSPTAKPYFALMLGILATSTAAIFIRLAQEEEISSLVIAAGRLIVASVVLTPFVIRRYRPEIQGLTRRELGIGLLGGVLLAVHFAAWITSLEYTSVTASVVLVTTNPLFVALLSLPMLGEKVSQRVFMGIGLAFVGGLVVALSGDAGDPPTRSAPLLGNGLALIGAIAVALYFMVGRRLRGKLSLIPYIWLVYGSAAVIMSSVVLIGGQPIFGFALIGYVWIVAMGLIPQLIGHSSYNYALGHLPAAFVSLAGLAEPIGSTILAIIVLQEFPSLLSLIGSAIILMGILSATRAQGE